MVAKSASAWDNKVIRSKSAKNLFSIKVLKKDKVFVHE